MVRWESELAQVTGIILNDERRIENSEEEEEYMSLAVVLTRGKYLGKRIQMRRYLVDGAARIRSNFVGRLGVVMFRPEDLRLVEGSPSRRRQFLDDSLSQTSSIYAKALTAYEGALRRRNRILDAIREGRANRTQLAFWDATLIKNGNILTDERREFCEYLSGVTTAFGQYQVDYNSSTVSTARLKQYENEEVAAGYTLVGPHKDDFRIMSIPMQSGSSYSTRNERDDSVDLKGVSTESKDLHKYGSRGEQRLAVLFLKLAAMAYLEEKRKVKPILLLDDIFSELDQKHREEVLKMMEGRQTIMTTAEEEVLGIVAKADIIRL